MNLYEVAKELSRRLAAIFQRDANGHRPVFGGTEKFQTDPHRRDCIHFYEYFHGDNGAGPGASHQTGQTGIVARIMQVFAILPAHRVLDSGAAGMAKEAQQRKAQPQRPARHATT